MAIAVIAFLPLHPIMAFDLYLHDTYFVVGHRTGTLGFALLCGISAGLYFLGDRFLGHRLNKGLTLAHFLLWIFAFVSYALEGLWLVREVISQQYSNQSRLWIAGLMASILSFILGGVLFLVNLARAMVLKFRTS